MDLQNEKTELIALKNFLTKQEFDPKLSLTPDEFLKYVTPEYFTENTHVFTHPLNGRKYEYTVIPEDDITKLLDKKIDETIMEYDSDFLAELVVVTSLSNKTNLIQHLKDANFHISPNLQKIKPHATLLKILKPRRATLREKIVEQKSGYSQVLWKKEFPSHKQTINLADNKTETFIIFSRTSH